MVLTMGATLLLHQQLLLCFSPWRQLYKMEPPDTALEKVKRQIEDCVEHLNGVTDQLIKVRSRMRRLLRQSSEVSPTLDVDEINEQLRSLHQEEVERGEQVRIMQQTLDDLWSLRRIIENRPIARSSESPLENEERNLRWQLIEAKNAQMQASEDWAASSNENERIVHEKAFNKHRDEYHRLYQLLTKVRERTA